MRRRASPGRPRPGRTPRCRRPDRSRRTSRSRDADGDLGRATEPRTCAQNTVAASGPARGCRRPPPSQQHPCRRARVAAAGPWSVRHRTPRPLPSRASTARCPRPRARPSRRRSRPRVVPRGRTISTLRATVGSPSRRTPTAGRAAARERRPGRAPRAGRRPRSRWRPRGRPRSADPRRVTTISSTSGSGLSSTPIAAATTATSTPSAIQPLRRRRVPRRGPHGDVRRCEVRPGCAPPTRRCLDRALGARTRWSSVDAAGAPGPRCDRVRRSRGRRTDDALTPVATGVIGAAKPTSTVSACRSTPLCSCTRRATSAIRASTSSAGPPSSAWMKLACFVDTSAVPSRRPLQPAASIRRPAESPGGLVNTEPALWPPGWLARRHRTISASCGLAGAASRPGGGEARPRPRPGTRPIDECAVAEVERGARAPSTILPGREVDDADPCEHRGHVRAVAAGVHPHRAADRAGHADGPLEAR